MEIFEFHFKPKKRKNIEVKSFFYFPKTKEERKFGKLIFLGEVKKLHFEKEEFLEKLENVIKKTFYKKNFKDQLTHFREGLKTLNEFLKKEVEGKNYLLGNLNLILLSIRKFQLFFSKVGMIKIFILRGKQIFDVEKKIKNRKMLFSHSGFFNHIFSGKLIKGDLILILTSEIENFFEKEKIFSEIDVPFRELNFRKILNSKKEKLKDVAGACIFIQKREVGEVKTSLIDVLSSLPLLQIEKIKEEIEKRKIFLLLFLFFFLLFMGIIFFQ